jgi:glycosyltransferase XagB
MESLQKNILTHQSDFLFLPRDLSAIGITWREVCLRIFPGVFFLTFGAIFLSYFFSVSPLLFISAAIACIYFTAFLFKLIALIRGVKTPNAFAHIEQTLIEGTPDDSPVYKTYTVIIPLYQEAEVMGQIYSAMTSLRYPKDKLRFIITVERYDEETKSALRQYNFPEHFQILELPDVKPKTKPKALNVALKEVTSEYLVIYDAEIVPDPDQLKKAAWAFHQHSELAAFQTRLDHYNPEHNIITSLFNSEFSAYYDILLPGLKTMNVPFPLSGHSVHFKVKALQDAGGWDPYNVTEDVDLGVRLWRFGYRYGVLDSLSSEEATTSLSTWIKQRTRWMKGFLQTAIVHLRSPRTLMRELGGLWTFVAFVFIVPASTIFNLLNLLFIALTLVWIIWEPVIIQGFYTGPILYITYFTTICGVFISMYISLYALYHRKRYSIVQYAYLSPLYWGLLSVAALRAMYQLFTNPTSWEKTRHGTHIAK